VRKSQRIPNDRQRLERAFRNLRKRDIVALASVRGTRSDGWTAVAEQGADDDTSCVFWTSEAAVDAFSDGRLARRLCLQWRGDSVAIVNALRAEGLRADPPRSAKETIDVRGAAGKPQPPLPEKPTAKKAREKSSVLSPALAAVQRALDALAAKGWRILFKPSMTVGEANSLKPRTLGFSMRSLSAQKPKDHLLIVEFGGDAKVAMAAFRKQKVSIALVPKYGGASLWIDLDKTAKRVAPRSR
jgi:hypothetical protein